MIKYLITCLIFLLVNNGVLYALTLDKAAVEVAEHFSKTDVRHDDHTEMYIKVVNAYSKETDDTSKSLEKGLLQAFAGQFTEMEVSIGAAKPNTIQISANYRQRGIAILLQVIAYNTATKDVVLGSKVIKLVLGEERDAIHAAVLNMTSSELSEDQKEDFGDDLRSELEDTDLFEEIEMVDSDDYDIDTTRKGSGCAEHVMLDRCAREIGIQMNVDWVVSSNYIKASDDTYILSGKILDIVSNTALATETLEHDGNLDTLEDQVDILAENLASSVSVESPPGRVKEPYIPLMVTGRSRLPSRAELLAESASLDSTRRAPFNWHIAAFTTIGITSTLSFIFAMNYNDHMEDARDAIERGDYEDYDEASRQAKEMQRSYEVTDGMLVAALLWEAYLLFFSDINLDGTLDVARMKTEIKPTENGYAETSLSFQWSW